MLILLFASMKYNRTTMSSFSSFNNWFNFFSQMRLLHFIFSNCNSKNFSPWIYNSLYLLLSSHFLFCNLITINLSFIYTECIFIFILFFRSLFFRSHFCLIEYSSPIIFYSLILSQCKVFFLLVSELLTISSILLCWLFILNLFYAFSTFLCLLLCALQSQSYSSLYSSDFVFYFLTLVLFASTLFFTVVIVWMWWNLIRFPYYFNLF